MVLAVCRRVLRQEQDAEDAFQAAFLVLARKAAAVRRGAVGSFLYATAHRTALEARAANARRRQRERQVEALPDPAVGPAEVQDWRLLLDAELNRLPEQFRSAVVLCDLGGRSRREAARLLGVPEGTLSSRLARGRRLLARRLTRYGLAVAGAALAGPAEGTAPAVVPAALAVATVKAAPLVAAGHAAALAGPAAGLLRGVLRAMLLKKIKVVVAVALLGTALGAGGLAYRAGDAPPDAAKPTVSQLVQELAEVRKRQADLEAQEKKLLEALRGEVREQRLALDAVERGLKDRHGAAAGLRRRAVLASERDGKLLFVGTEVKPGEAVPENVLVKPEPWFPFLVVQADPKDPDSFTFPDNPTSYRRWREGDTPEPNRFLVARERKRIRELRVGDRVTKGQLVAMVNPAVTFAELGVQVARLDASQAEFLAAIKTKETTHQRYQAMITANRNTPGSVSEDEVRRARLDWDKAIHDEKVKEAAIRSAQAEVNKVLATLLQHEVRSPITGVVTKIDKRAGEMARSGGAILEIREP
jgi:RNA polymerase sigma factor (sigma-70 family)